MILRVASQGKFLDYNLFDLNVILKIQQQSHPAHLHQLLRQDSATR
jgi:hypothetical protein